MNMHKHILISFILFAGIAAGADEKKLAPNLPANWDHFGAAVSMDGDYAICGAPEAAATTGSAYIFCRNLGGPNSWAQQAKLSQGPASSRFGNSVSISNEYAVVGAPATASTSGAAYIFKRNKTVWTLVKTLTDTSGSTGDFFAESVCICGDYVIVGSPNDDDQGSNSGSAFIFYRHQGGANNWGLQKQVYASTAAKFDEFGSSVSITQDYAIVGAPKDDDKGSNSGAAFIFYRNQGGANNWGQQKLITGIDSGTSDFFGDGVSIDGDHAAVGAWGDNDNGLSSGSAYIFYRSGTNWIQDQKILAKDGSAQALFGCAVNINFPFVIVGARGDNFNGAAYTYYYNTVSWIQESKLLPSNAGTDDDFGCSVDIEYPESLVGGQDNDENGTDAGMAYLYAFNLLECDAEEVSALNGGVANFFLHAGAQHAGKAYGILAGATGTSPGTPFPGGSLLPLNWDIVTNIFFSLGLPAPNVGILDTYGKASAVLAVPPGTPLVMDLILYFAYAVDLNPAPWLCSNPVQVLIKAKSASYMYDDGSSEMLHGWPNGGELCWMHGFQTSGPDTIKYVDACFGCPAFPGMSPGNGTQVMVYIWEDPTNDMNPIDCVLLDAVPHVVTSVDTDTFETVVLNAPQTINGVFFVGVSMIHNPGQMVAPMDLNTLPYTGEAWVAGSPIPGGFNPTNLAAGTLYEMGANGWPHYFLLRAGN